MASFILVVLLTIYSESGTIHQQKFTLNFENQKTCREVRNLINVGLSFYDLASKNTHYSAYVGQCSQVKNRKPVKQGGIL